MPVSEIPKKFKTCILDFKYVCLNSLVFRRASNVENHRHINWISIIKKTDLVRRESSNAFQCGKVFIGVRAWSLQTWFKEMETFFKPLFKHFSFRQKRNKSRTVKNDIFSEIRLLIFSLKIHNFFAPYALPVNLNKSNPKFTSESLLILTYQFKLALRPYIVNFINCSTLDSN